MAMIAASLQETLSSKEAAIMAITGAHDASLAQAVMSETHAAELSAKLKAALASPRISQMVFAFNLFGGMIIYSHQ
jgi:hypothetical protein